MIFTNLNALVNFAKIRANVAVYNGKVNAANQYLIQSCKHIYKINPEVSCQIIYTRDSGHNSSGWWKNPEYERCLHLSLSFYSDITMQHLPFDKKEAEKIVQHFFGDDASKAWIEPPYSEEGKRVDSWHYRVFCDPSWTPIIPRKEVYSKDFTDAGFKSFSEIHGVALDDVDLAA